MVEQQVEIINKLGLHARAAAKLVQTASQFASETELEHKGNSADAKSIMSVMMLAAAQGSQLNIRCKGDDEQAALSALIELIEDYFGEGE